MLGQREKSTNLILPKLQRFLTAIKNADRFRSAFLLIHFNLYAWDDPFIVRHTAPVAETSNDFFTCRVEVVLEKFREASIEKFRQNFRTAVITFFPNFRLRVHLQEPAWNHAAFNVQRV